MSLELNHEGFLAYASQRMIRYSRSEKFMQWVCHYLHLHLKPTQVSIALYNKQTKTFSIEVSEGRHKIPSKLISLPDTNPLIHWFVEERGETLRGRRAHRWITAEQLREAGSAESEAILRELLLHHVEVCFKIETHERLAGYLMIGPKESGASYTEEDIVFLQTLANNLSIEIEKEEYWSNSFSDPLTGLLNRSTMLDRLQDMLIKAQTDSSAHDFAIAMIDIDDFKMINDHFGHLTGDQVIRAAASMIRAGIRETDHAFRYGGEEFLLILKKTSRDPQRIPTRAEFEADIQAVLERLREKFVARPLMCLGKMVPVSFSAGVTFLRDSAQSPEALILQADQALYRAKHEGKNRVIVYEDGV